MHQPAERGSDVKGASSLSQRRRICPAHQSRLPWEGCTGSACLTPSSVCMTHGHPRGHGQEPTEGLTTAACGAHEASSSGLPRPAETMGQGICTGGTWGPAQELCTGATWVSAASGPGPGKLRRWAGTSGAHHCKATARNHVHVCACPPFLVQSAGSPQEVTQPLKRRTLKFLEPRYAGRFDHTCRLAPIHASLKQPTPSPLSNGSSNHNGTGEVSEPHAVVSCPHVYTRNCMPVILLS